MTERPQPLSLNERPSDNQQRWRLLFSWHNWPTWLGLGFILPLALYYWQHYSEHISQQQHAIFQQHADNIENELHQRLQHIELLLRANAAFVSSSAYVSQTEWQHYVSSLKLSQMYPGVQALGIVSYRSGADLPLLLTQVNHELTATASLGQPKLPQIRVYPAGERPHYGMVSHIQPMTAQNQAVLGYDLMSDPMRLQTAMRAASLNEPALTAKISLQQDHASSNQPGLLLMFPIYRPAALLVTAQDKMAALQGFVYAAFRVRDVLPSAWLAPSETLLDFAWYSGSATSDHALLFARQSEVSSLPMQKHRHLAWYGQPFVLQVNNNALFEIKMLPLAEYELVILGVTGLAVLFLLLSYLNFRRYQAQHRSKQLQQQLQQQRQLLLQDEQRQSLALKASQLAWFEFDLRSGDAFYADHWWRLFDFNNAQPNPEPQQLFDLVHPADLTLFRQDVQRLLANGPDLDQQHYRFISRQGRQLYCLVHFYVVRSVEGDAIRLCCTMQDVTLQQQQADARRQLSALCQQEVALAWQLSQQLLLALHTNPNKATPPQSNNILADFQQQHCSWLLQFYSQACSELGFSASMPPPESQHPLTNPDPSVSRKRSFVTLMTDLIQCYQPLFATKGLQLCRQSLKFSDRVQLNHHSFWQLGCGVVQLACHLAATGSSLSIELQPFQTKIALRLQLTMDEATAKQFPQEMAVLSESTPNPCSFVQQRLSAVQFWAGQLAAELTVQQEQQSLTLHLLLAPDTD